MTRVITMSGEMAERRLTVGQLIAGKGTRRFIQATAVGGQEAIACDAAGIDMLSVGDGPALDEIRRAAPTMYLSVALPLTRYASADEVMRAAMDALEHGADSIYYCGPLAWVEHLAKADIPVMGHSGLVPRKSHWRGGLRAVGKSHKEAMQIWQAVKNLEQAGAFAVEFEAMPSVLTREITRRTTLVTSSIGAGPDADIIYQFTEDVLGETPEPPRHARAYDDFQKRYVALQDARITALQAFKADVDAGAYPSDAESIAMDDDDLAQFLDTIGRA
ncbi:MAG: 3-methyl-2-oxobutanoate hydroxymethyltransferase [Alphaproteobacteria bacterium]